MWESPKSYFAYHSKIFHRQFCAVFCELSKVRIPSSRLQLGLQLAAAVSITCNVYKLLWDIISYDFSQLKWLIRALNWRPLRHHYETSHLTSLVFVNSKVHAFLNVVDIAGLVKGASEGQGLGNAFLSHINACDGIFHLCRKFQLKSFLLCGMLKIILPRNDATYEISNMQSWKKNWFKWHDTRRREKKANWD